MQVAEARHGSLLEIAVFTRFQISPDHTIGVSSAVTSRSAKRRRRERLSARPNDRLRSVDYYLPIVTVQAPFSIAPTVIVSPGSTVCPPFASYQRKPEMLLLMTSPL